jgi:tetratricopeptide (TPR) repeat protein
MRPLATLHAMGGRFDEAQMLLERANEILADLAIDLTSAAYQEDGSAASARAESPASSATSGSGYAALEEMGDHAFRATTAAILAQTMYQLEEFEEALEFADAAQRAAADDDLAAQILWRGVRAQVLAQRGEVRRPSG